MFAFIISIIIGVSVIVCVLQFFDSDYLINISPKLEEFFEKSYWIIISIVICVAASFIVYFILFSE